VTQVDWHGDGLSWVSYDDFVLFAQKKIPLTPSGPKFKNFIGKHIQVECARMFPWLIILLLQVDWRGVYNFQLGVVTKKNKDGTFKIEYDDGDGEDLALHSVCTDQKLIESKYGHKHKVYEWCIM